MDVHDVPHYIIATGAPVDSCVMYVCDSECSDSILFEFNFDT